MLAIWWLVASLSLPYFTTRLFSYVIITLTPLWAGGTSFAVSRLVRGHRISGLLLGGFVTGIVGGWLGYQVSGRSSEEGAQIGFTYGALVGAALVNYFFSESKQTSLFWGLSSTLVFVACIGAFTGLEAFKEGWWHSLPVAVFTLVIGVEVVLISYLWDSVLQRRRERAVEEAEAGDAWEEGDEGEDAEAVDAVSSVSGGPGLFGRLSAAWGSLGRFRMALILLAAGAAVGLTLWKRAELVRWLGGSAPEPAAVAGARRRDGLTRESETYSVTLAGCRKERFKDDERMTCQLYVTNKTDSDYNLSINPFKAIAVDDLGIDHVPTLAQIGLGQPSQDASKVIPGGARISARVAFSSLEQFKSPTLSLLRVTLVIDNAEHRVEFGDVKIDDAAAGAPGSKG